MLGVGILLIAQCKGYSDSFNDQLGVNIFYLWLGK